MGIIDWLRQKVNIFQQIRSHKVIVQNTGYLTAVEIMRMLLPFVALPYVIRTIGADRYGTVVFAQTIISYFVVFINFGMDVSAVKDVSVHRNNRKELNRIISTVLLLKFILFLCALVILSIGIICIPYLRSECLLYLFAFISCLSEILFPIWFYQGIEKMKYLTIIRFSSILFYTIAVFFFIRTSEDYKYVALLQSLGLIISGVISFYVLVKLERVHLVQPSIKDLKKCFVDSIPFFMSRLSVVLNNGMAKLVSGIFFSMQAVAAFDLAQKMANAALIPMQMMNQAVYPHIARTKSLSFVRKYFKIDILLSLIIAFSIGIIAPYAVSFFAGDKIPTAVPLLRVLCLWLFFGGITTYIGAPVLVSFGFPKPFNISVILSSVTLFLLYIVLYLSNVFSIYNFAWALVISEFIILLYRMFYCLKYKLI